MDYALWVRKNCKFAALTSDNINDLATVKQAITMELQAASTYEQMALSAKSEKLRKVLLDVAKEEKVHVGEFEAVLGELDKEFPKAVEEGKKEVGGKKSAFLKEAQTALAPPRAKVPPLRTQPNIPSNAAVPPIPAQPAVWGTPGRPAVPAQPVPPAQRDTPAAGQYRNQLLQQQWKADMAKYGPQFDSMSGWAAKLAKQPFVAKYPDIVKNLNILGRMVVVLKEKPWLLKQVQTHLGAVEQGLNGLAAQWQNSVQRGQNFLQQSQGDIAKFKTMLSGLATIKAPAIPSAATPPVQPAGATPTAPV